MGEQTTRRSGGYGDSEVTRESHGDVKYLAMASRIAGLAVPLASAAARAELKADDGGQKSEVGGPPVEDCSRLEAPAAHDAEVARPHVDANEGTDEVCEEIESRRREFLAALADEPAPVQIPRGEDGHRLLDEPVEGETVHVADVLPLSSLASERSAGASLLTRPLSRKERRARRRLLERRLRRKVK
jgi:hypothetical protein